MNLGALAHPSAVTPAASVGGRIDFTLDQPATPDPKSQLPSAVESPSAARPLSSFDIVSPEENAALASAFVHPESGYRSDGQALAGPHPVGTHLDLSV